MAIHCSEGSSLWSSQLTYPGTDPLPQKSGDILSGSQSLCHGQHRTSPPWEGGRQKMETPLFNRADLGHSLRNRKLAAGWETLKVSGRELGKERVMCSRLQNLEWSFCLTEQKGRREGTALVQNIVVSCLSYRIFTDFS